MSRRTAAVEAAKARFAELLQTPRATHFYPLPTPPRAGAPADLFAGTGEASLYIHIPYCMSRCTYCFFVTQIGLGADDIDAYIGELEQEIALCREALAGFRFTSIYFGGGTPGLLSPEAFGRLALAVAPLRAEAATATLETHPHFCSDARIAAWQEAGFDRVSVGVQTVDGALLDLVNRGAQKDETVPALERLLAAGFSDINVDILYGLPDQTMASWLETLDALIGLGVPSMSSYVTTLVLDSLKAFTGKGATFCSHRLVREMYHESFVRLNAAGYRQEHYGCSYFSKLPYAHGLNIHRQHVMAGLPMVGLGMGAYGAVPGYTYLNFPVRAGFRAALAAGRLPVISSCVIPEQERAHKYAVEAWKVGFLHGPTYEAKFGEPPAARFGAELQALAELGEIEEKGGEYHLTRRGAARQHVIGDMFMSEAAREHMRAQFGGRTA